MAALTIALRPTPSAHSLLLEPPSPGRLTPDSTDERYHMHLYQAASGDSASTLVGSHIKMADMVDGNLLEKVSSKVPSFATTVTTTSASVTLDGDAPAKAAKADKASAKAAKRKARRDLNRAKRKAEAEVTEPKLQPWEVALRDLGNSAQGISQSAPTNIASSQPIVPNSSSRPAFVVPAHTRRGHTIPKRTYDLTHGPAVAAVEALVAHHGSWSITFADPSYRIYLSPALDVAISFKVVRGLGVAVAFGDPACHPARLASAIAEFHAFCAARRLNVAFVSARSATARVGEACGWASAQCAVEQIVEPASNPVLDGTRGRRQTLVVKKLAREAPVHLYHPADGRNPALEAQLQAAYDTVFGGKEARDGAPYTTKLRLFALPHVTTVLYTAGADGPNGLIGLLRVGERAYLADPVVATPAALPGTTDYLTVLAMGYLRRLGASLSFGTEPTAHVGEVRGMCRPMEADTRIMHAATYTAFGMAGKKTLHDKFHPSRAEALHIVLGSSSIVGQSAAAAAVARATHIHCRPVLRSLVGLVKQRVAGERIHSMLATLVRRGQLKPSLVPYTSSGSDTACEEAAEDS